MDSRPDGETWWVTHTGGAAWWADRGNTAIGPFENRDVAAMVVNNLNDVLHLDHKKAAEYWIDRACKAEDALESTNRDAAAREQGLREAREALEYIAGSKPDLRGERRTEIARKALAALDHTTEVRNGN